MQYLGGVSGVDEDVVPGGKLKVHLENGDTLVFDEKPGTVAWSGY